MVVHFRRSVAKEPSRGSDAGGQQARPRAMRQTRAFPALALVDPRKLRRADDDVVAAPLLSAQP